MRTTKKKPASVSVKLDRDVYENLKDYAKERGISLTWLVNRAVRDLLTKELQ